MIRVLLSIIAIPFLCGLAAWIGQYLFPAISWGQSTLNYEMDNGVTAMIPQKSIAPFIMFVIPNKLSIVIWAVSLLISVFIIFPCIFLFRKMGWDKLAHSVIFGFVLGVALPTAIYVIYPMIMEGRIPIFSYYLIQLFGYCAFLGSFVSIGFWIVAIRSNFWFRLTRLSN